MSQGILNINTRLAVFKDPYVVDKVVWITASTPAITMTPASTSLALKVTGVIIKATPDWAPTDPLDSVRLESTLGFSLKLYTLEDLHMMAQEVRSDGTNAIFRFMFLPHYGWSPHQLRGSTPDSFTVKFYDDTNPTNVGVMSGSLTIALIGTTGLQSEMIIA